MKKRSLVAFSLLILTTIIFFQLPTKEAVQKLPLSYPPIEVAPKEQEGVRHQRDQPHLAMQQEFEMTLDNKLGYPPTQRKVEAYKTLKGKFSQKTIEQSAITGVQWIERGSDNIGGRTRALMFDPNDNESKKVWAGSVAGGLWYNNDITSADTRWQQENNIMSNLAISTIAYDPSNPQTFYLGTGLGFTSLIRGAGIWKSINGGTDWIQLISTISSSFHFVQKIKVTNKGTVLAATTAGLYRSTDGGSSWLNMSDGRFGDIDIATDGTIYAAKGVNSTGGIFKSIDDGLTWSDITPAIGGLRTTVATAPSNPDVLYAIADGGLEDRDIEYFMKSIDGGTTWKSITIPNYYEQGSCAPGLSYFTRGQAWFNLSLEIHPENPDIVFAGGIDTHRSIDGGENWESISYWTGGNCLDYAHADIHEFQIRPDHPNTLVVGNDGGIDFSTDAGNASSPNFERRVRGYNTLLFYYAAMVNELGSNVMLAGAQDNGTQRFTKIGMNSTRSATGGDGSFCFIDPNNPNVQISSFTNNNYNLSTDGGLNFERLDEGLSTGRFINPTDVDFESGILYSAAGANQLGRITNVPASPDPFSSIPITELRGAIISAVKVSPYTKNRIFVGTNSGGGGRIYMLDNAHLGTIEVTDITGSIDSNRGNYLRSIDLGASDDEILIAFSNYGANSIYLTSDGGGTWINKEDNLPDIPVRWALFNPSNRKQVLIATDLGVWSTNDITVTNPGWESTNDGLASVRVDHLLYRPADETILAATHGRGLFTSNVFASTIKADFKARQVVAYAGIPMSFEDASLLHGDSWSWDFGDGNTSAVQNPNHTYQNAGTYDVELTIAEGTSTENKPAYVTVLPSLNVPYLAADGGDFESNPEHFTSRALLNDLNLWESGTPTNTLSVPFSGSMVWKTKLDSNITEVGYDHKSAFFTPAFNLSETAKDYTLSFRLSAETIFCNLPIAMQAQYSLDGGMEWQTLGNSNTEAGSENWYNRGPSLGCSIDDALFDDKIGWNTQSGSNPDVNLLSKIKLNFLAGQPNVSFRFVVAVLGGITGSTDPYAVDGFMLDDFEILATDPNANFSAEPLLTYVNEDVRFSYASNGADSFLWNFGDNNVSTDRNPSHSYTNPGNYTIVLTATANGIPVTETKPDYITVLDKKSVPYLLTDGGNFDVNIEDFKVENNAGTQFQLGSSNIIGKDGTASGDNAWVTGLNSSRYIDDSDSRLRSPMFAFNEPNRLYALEFKAKYSFEANWDGFIVNYSTDNGLNWIKLNNKVESGWYNQISDAQSVFGATTPMFSGTTNGEFLTFSTDVTFLYSEDVIFEFMFLSDANEVDAGMALDDFQIILSDSDPVVSDFTIQTGSGCAGQQVVFTSTSTGSVHTYSWDFGNNASPATAVGKGPHTITYTERGSSTVILEVNDVFNQSDTEEKTDVIITGALHSPSFIEEDNGDRNTARLVATAGDTYQWYKNSSLIAGATDQVYIATEIANYIVAVTIDGCRVDTGQQHIVTSSEEEQEFRQGVSIFPNPVRDVLNVKVSNSNMGELRIRFLSISGATILDQTVQKLTFDAEYSFQLSEYKAGVYLVEVTSEKGKSVKRVFKEN